MFLEALVQHTANDLGSKSAGAAGFILAKFNLVIFLLDHQIAKLKTSPNFLAIQ